MWKHSWTYNMHNKEWPPALIICSAVMSFTGLYQTSICEIFTVATASHYKKDLWFVTNWFMSSSNNTKKCNCLLHILSVQEITICIKTFQFSSQDSPCSSRTFSALRTCRSTIFAIEIASISGRKHLSDDKPNPLWSNRVLNYWVCFSLDSSSHPAGPGVTLLRQDHLAWLVAPTVAQPRHFPHPDKHGFPDNVDTFSTGWR